LGVVFALRPLVAADVVVAAVFEGEPPPELEDPQPDAASTAPPASRAARPLIIDRDPFSRRACERTIAHLLSRRDDRLLSGGEAPRA